jgi:single-strand DNA-binding protein
MASYNRVILMGNLTRDIELRYTPGGTAVTDASLAVNNKRKNQNNEWVDEVCYVDVTLWGRTAEVASEYLSKGSPIFVEGHLKLDTWETDGKKNSRLRVVCDRMQMVGGGTTGGGGQGSGGNAGSVSSGKRPTASVNQSLDGHETVRESHSRDFASNPSSERVVHRADAGPTGDGPGYDDGDIPF